ncbi:Spc7 kinetochore protein-domain-containing protein [Phyllosticta citrichinensis]
MSADLDKENIAEGLSVGATADKSALSPKKSGRKTRSKSIGPGGLEVPLKENSGNRRKSAMPVVPVKSILSREDEVKRREERRKSLAKRRVSFAPEATLHTWDVVEYMRDATSSSASSNSTRRESNATHAHSSPERASAGVADPPSTPPEQVEDDLPESSPERRRDLHQKKHRRSSGIPPMNFNDPNAELSSSPYSGSSAAGSDEVEVASDDDDDGSTMMSLDVADDNEPTTASVASNDSTGSSARLDAALREAAAHAGTRRLDFEEEEDESMEMAGDEITAAFKPWVQKKVDHSGDAQADPFASASRGIEAQDEDDMTMEMTRPVGGILQSRAEDSPISNDATMEFTTAIGGIKQPSPKTESSPHAGNKRRRTLDISTDDQESPAKRQGSRRMSIRRRKSIVEASPLEDQTVDFTVAVGGIQSNPSAEQPSRRESPEISFFEDAMDMTVAQGKILNAPEKRTPLDDTVTSKDGNEDLSMEFTHILGGIKYPEIKLPEGEAVSATPESKQTAVATPPSKRGSVARFTNNHPEIPSPSPMKVSNSVIANAEEVPITKLNIKKQPSPRKSPRRSPRKSIASTMANPESISNQSSSLNTQTNEEEDASPPAYESKDQVSIKTPPKEQSPTLTPTTSTPAQSHAETPEQLKENSPKKQMALSDSIKLLSTPRKQIFASPVKRAPPASKQQSTPKMSTPKKTTPKKSSWGKTSTPQTRPSPLKQVQFNSTSPEKEAIEEDSKMDGEDESAERISLREFLELTNIRFMDLTTTKRRHTGFPGAVNGMGISIASSVAEMEGKTDMETNVVAAASVEPEYGMYHYACHALKNYISEGKNLVRQIEENTCKETPALFREYLSAPPDQRYIMESQFKNMKTNARLKTKEVWYGWRSNLLRELSEGLSKTSERFDADDKVLKEQEEILDSVLPELHQKYGQVESECKNLQRRVEELNGPDREELDSTRARLVATEESIEEKKRLVEALQKELAEKESSIEVDKTRKVEIAEEIKTAERIREECRGWSVGEVDALKSRVSALEAQTGWSITSASVDPATLTMAYRNDLQLFFYPGSFAPHARADAPNSTISLSYVGENKSNNSSPLTTTKRFFLQILRANLHCLPQSTTSITQMLTHIRNGWDVALAVAENVRRLNLCHITEESILSDERMATTAHMLLPMLQTKVKCTFEISVTAEGDELKTSVATSTKVVYGEQYKEGKMGEFLSSFVGGEIQVGDANWSEAVNDLKARLIAKGRK